MLGQGCERKDARLGASTHSQQPPLCDLGQQGTFSEYWY